MAIRFYLDREYQKDIYYVMLRDRRSTMNFHSPIEVWMVHEGAIRCWINGQSADLCPGEMVVAFSYDIHNFQVLEKGTVVGNLIVPLSLCGEFQTLFNQKRTPDPFIRDRAVFERVYESLQKMEQAENEMAKRGYLFVALGTLMERLALEKRSEQANPQLSTRLLCYLQENYRSELSLRSVASALGYHPAYLSQYFKDCFHISFGKYLTLLRLRTCVLLMKEGKSLSECAFESGFGSLRTFHRVFQEEFQCTPKQYMKGLEQKEN